MTNVVWDKYDNTATIVRALAQSTSAEQAIQLYENAVEELGKLFAAVYADIFERSRVCNLKRIKEN